MYLPSPSLIRRFRLTLVSRSVSRSPNPVPSSYKSRRDIVGPLTFYLFYPFYPSPFGHTTDNVIRSLVLLNLVVSPVPSSILIYTRIDFSIFILNYFIILFIYHFILFEINLHHAHLLFLPDLYGYYCYYYYHYYYFSSTTTTTTTLPVLPPLFYCYYYYHYYYHTTVSTTNSYDYRHYDTVPYW